MSKAIKVIIIIILIDVVLIGGYFGLKLLSSKKSQSDTKEYEWVRVDEYYLPKDYIEEYILKDSQAKELLPVFIKNYGRDKKVLNRFYGKNFVSPSEAQIKLQYRSLEDWQLIDLKYTDENEREIKRTILYVQENGSWKVGDFGVLTQ
jgi:uncharacterized protein YneF (UPF0154 family)